MTTTNTAPIIEGTWHNKALPPGQRAQALLSQMTVQEKLAQLGSSWPGAEEAGGDVAPMQDTVNQALPFDEEIHEGLGHLTRAFGTAPITPEDGTQRLANLQREVQNANRFRIPAIAHEECLTGFTTWKATVYPTALAWAATFNPALVHSMAAAIGQDMAGVGVHQGLSPVLDVVRDYRWGRVEETLGEDPYLVSQIGGSYVTGLQSAGVIATLKHFAGYSASRGARNHAPVAIGPRELQDVILPPFEHAVALGVRSVMNSYTEIDGVPAASDEYLLTTLLRETWGFTGTVVSDYWAIPFLQSMHRTAATTTEAGLQALTAGIDVELPHTLSFGKDLGQSNDNDILDLIDRAVLRVLTQKAEVGLLDADWDPTANVRASIDLDSAGNRDIARKLAEESIILLENPHNLLPLEKSPASIAVIGPGIDDPGCFFGCYSFPNHVVPNHPGTGIGVATPTLREALVREFPESVVRGLSGADINSSDRSRIDAAVALAAVSEVTILMVGDRSGMFGHGTSGEGCDALDLRLPGVQEDLVTAVLKAAPNVVLMTVSGRPYAVGDLANSAAAALQVFFPGEEGGTAIAGVISGRVNPSGRLPVQIPSTASSQPGTYLAPPLALKSDGVSNIDPTPAYPFGFGLSYTQIDIVGVSADRDRMSLDGTTRISARLRNSGARSGWHIPQLYLSHGATSVTRPVRRLIGFHRVFLAPGSEVRVDFDVHADLTSFTGRDGRRRVEPGRIQLAVSDNASAAGFAVDVQLEGRAPRYVNHLREMTVPSSATTVWPEASRP